MSVKLKIVAVDHVGCVDGILTGVCKDDMQESVAKADAKVFSA